MNRKLIIGAALVLVAMVSVTVYLNNGGLDAFAAGTPQVNTKIAIHGDKNHVWRWRNPGGKPFVPFNGKDGNPIPQIERRKTAEAYDGKVLEAQGVPQEARGGIMKEIALHPDGDTIFYAVDGTRYLGITYGGPSITKNVTVDFGSKVSIHDDKRKAAEWSFRDHEGRLWIYDRFGWWCINSGIRSIPAKRIVKRHCYQVYYDYTSTPGVDSSDGTVHHEVHFNVTSDTMDELVADDCTFAHDETGDHKVVVGCDCDGFGGYPPAALAAANGLPETEPEGVGHWTGGKKGYLSLPADFHRSGLYCVRVNGYALKTTGFRRDHSISRFDIVSRTDILAHPGYYAGPLKGDSQF